MESCTCRRAFRHSLILRHSQHQFFRFPSRVLVGQGNKRKLHSGPLVEPQQRQSWSMERALQLYSPKLHVAKNSFVQHNMLPRIKNCEFDVHIFRFHTSSAFTHPFFTLLCSHFHLSTSLHTCFHTSVFTFPFSHFCFSRPFSYCSIFTPF